MSEQTQPHQHFALGGRQFKATEVGTCPDHTRVSEQIAAPHVGAASPIAVASGPGAFCNGPPWIRRSKLREPKGKIGQTKIVGPSPINERPIGR